MMKILVDTSAILAAMNFKDQYHQQAIKYFNKLAEYQPTLYISNYIRAESHALLNSRANPNIALSFLEDKT